MTEFTRLTIIGTERKAELVVPNDEAIGRLLPRLMDLLGEPSGSVARPLTLVRSTGEQLDVALTAADQQVLDGELLRIVRSDDAPPPPEVADVTDVLGESLRDRAGLWSDRSREVTGAIAMGVLGLAVSALVPVDELTAAIAIVVLMIGASVAGRVGWRWGAVALVAAVLGTATAEFWSRTAAEGWDAANVAVGIFTFVLVGWVALRIGIGFGLRSPSVTLGSHVGALISLLPLLLLILSDLALPRVLVITAAVAVVVCGVLPRIALAASGLTGLDDQVVEGHPRRRDDVTVTVNDAYRTLSWATVAVAVPLAVTSALLIGETNPWAVAVGVVVAVVTVLRTRAFPLAVQQMALWFAVLAALIVGLVRQPRLSDVLVAVILAVVALLVVVLVVARPPAHQRAFWRRAGNLVEMLAVIALIPLLLGVFGVFGDLLGAFQR